MGKLDKLSNRQSLAPEFNPGPVEDRRIRGERLEVIFPVHATQSGNPINGYAQTINLSWSGMLMETNYPLGLGDRLALQFTLPGGDVSINVNARVVHRNDGRIPEEATLIGIAFEEMDPNVRRMISGFVLEHLPTK